MKRGCIFLALFLLLVVSHERAEKSRLCLKTNPLELLSQFPSFNKRIPLPLALHSFPVLSLTVSSIPSRLSFFLIPSSLYLPLRVMTRPPSLLLPIRKIIVLIDLFDLRLKLQDLIPMPLIQSMARPGESVSLKSCFRVSLLRTSPIPLYWNK